jgi:hypothetical protein
VPFTARNRSTVTIGSPSGETAQIRPIDPEFWADDGNIEIHKYISDHDDYLSAQRSRGAIIYHYTSLEALHGIVRDGAIWASDVRQLNDRFEIKYPLECMHAMLTADTSYRQPLDAIFHSRRAWQFVSCFSHAPDQLSQWRAYGRKIGIAIAFDREHLKRAVEVRGGNVVDCRYLGPREFVTIKDELKPITQALRLPNALDGNGLLTDMKLQSELTRQVVHIATSIKHTSFAEEQEARLLIPIDAMSDAVEFRSSEQSLIPFTRLLIDGRKFGRENRSRFANHLGIMEITVWPNNVDDQILDAIDMLVNGEVLISRSASPYRS